jgi:hypothetical protein
MSGNRGPLEDPAWVRFLRWVGFSSVGEAAGGARSRATTRQQGAGGHHAKSDEDKHLVRMRELREEISSVRKEQKKLRDMEEDLEDTRKINFKTLEDQLEYAV